ncbi:hypothetical protein CspHIS471_0200170 [Cutaneotrichosporon sp. HIS471]|nr:hypothetical protein CspHIS471_0200170 [Cutaneotrichosporon sp. HIS471]
MDDICLGFPHIAPHIREGRWLELPRHIPEETQIRALYGRAERLQLMLGDLSTVLGTKPGGVAARSQIRLGMPFHTRDRVPEPPLILERADSPVQMVDRGISPIPPSSLYQQPPSPILFNPAYGDNIPFVEHMSSVSPNSRRLRVTNLSATDSRPATPMSFANSDVGDAVNYSHGLLEATGHDRYNGRSPSLTSDSASSISLPYLRRGSSPSRGITTVHAGGLMIHDNSSLAEAMVGTPELPGPVSPTSSTPVRGDIGNDITHINWGGITTFNGNNWAVTIGNSLASTALDYHVPSTWEETGRTEMPWFGRPLRRTPPPPLLHQEPITQASSGGGVSHMGALRADLQSTASQIFEEVGEETEELVRNLLGVLGVPDIFEALDASEQQENGGTPVAALWARPEDIVPHATPVAQALSLREDRHTSDTPQTTVARRPHAPDGVTAISPSISSSSFPAQKAAVSESGSSSDSVPVGSDKTKAGRNIKRGHRSLSPKGIQPLLQGLDAMFDRRKEKNPRRYADQSLNEGESEDRSEGKDKKGKATIKPKGGSAPHLTKRRSLIVRFGRPSSENKAQGEILGQQSAGGPSSSPSNINAVTRNNGSWDKISTTEADGAIAEWEPKLGEGSMRRLARKLRFAS